MITTANSLEETQEGLAGGPKPVTPARKKGFFGNLLVQIGRRIARWYRTSASNTYVPTFHIEDD